MRCLRQFATLVAVAALGGPARAASYPVPPAGLAIVGELGHLSSTEADTLVDLARRNGLGYEELILANPSVDRWLPGEGATVVLPTRYILPRGPREGIVVNIAEMRLYYFAPPEKKTPAMIYTWPVGVGRDDWKTPETVTKVSAKLKDPAWYPPATIRKEHAARGDKLPAMVPPGPKNPLGRHVLKLAIGGGYYIHGTSQLFGIGMPVTHGCVRLYPDDIEQLFGRAPVGAPVRIVNQPYKTAWVDGVLYVEAHPDVTDDAPPDFAELEAELRRAVRAHPGYEIDWEWVHDLALYPRGVPLRVPRAAATPRG